MNERFRWHGRRLHYWNAPYNNTRNNERAVELSIAAAWLGDMHGTPGLEVGNVLGHYNAPWSRRIVDLYEQAPDVENIDVADIEGVFPWVVSISTLEHVGLDYGEPRPMAATEAVLHLRDLLAPGGRMLVSIPFGANPDLDADIAMGALGVARQCTLHRLQPGAEPPTWEQAAEPVAPLPYDHEVRSARAVWIGEW